MTSTTAQPTRCLRCGRTLQSVRSCARGYGAWCAAKIRAAAVAEAVRGFAERQIKKARELIELGGLVPVRGQIFRAVSSDGERSYLTSAKGVCNCPNGLRSGRADRCYHVAAARLVAATMKGI